MDRRDFLWATASTGVGAAVAGTTSVFNSAPVAPEIAKGGGRALVSEPVAARVASGSFPFALSRFAEDGSMVTGKKYDPAAPGSMSVPVLSPLRDVSFRGFSTGAGAFAEDQLRVVAVHHAQDGVVARHELWSHAPMKRGGTSSPVLFTAHDDAFAGFEITHAPSAGPTTSGFFGFMAGGFGPQLKPGVYVLAGPSAATGVAPDLARYAYTGDVNAPVRENRALGLDFAYLSFVVYGEWM
jgi:hypothetical protein